MGNIHLYFTHKFTISGMLHSFLQFHTTFIQFPLPALNSFVRPSYRPVNRLLPLDQVLVLGPVICGQLFKVTLFKYWEQWMRDRNSWKGAVSLVNPLKFSEADTVTCTFHTPSREMLLRISKFTSTLLRNLRFLWTKMIVCVLLQFTSSLPKEEAFGKFVFLVLDIGDECSGSM